MPWAKKYAFFACCSLLFANAKAQIEPWWVANPPVDSSAQCRAVLADSVIRYAETFIGVPYVWGGSDPDSGFDCSGFVCYVYRKFGIALPRTSGQQFDAGYPVPYTDALPGDLILFSDDKPGAPGHVGIVLSYDTQKGFTFIHTASPSSGGVHISTTGDPYYYKHFLEIRRVIVQG